MIRATLELHLKIRISALLLLTCISLSGWAQNNIEIIRSADAGKHIGVICKVEGTVATVTRSETMRNHPVFINFDHPYPNETFTAVLYEKQYKELGYDPEKILPGKKLTVKGKIYLVKGKPHIRLNDKADMQVYGE